MMKKNIVFLTATVFLLLFILIIMYISCKNGIIVPYSNQTLFPKMYPYYEGMESTNDDVKESKDDKKSCESKKDKDESSNKETMKGKDKAKKESFLDYTTHVGNEIIDTVSQYNIPPSSNFHKILGFSGLWTSVDQPYTNPSDLFSKLPSSKDCKDYGLSNSTGFICYDNTSTQLMTSRGGNAVGYTA